MKEQLIRELVRAELVSEIGDTTDRYPLRVVEKGVFPRVSEIDLVYGFRTENHDYNVHIFNEYPDMLTVDFGTDETGSEATGEGKPFKVVSTVIEAAQRAWDIVEEREAFDNIRGFRFHAVPKPGEGKEGGTQREKLYMAFIRKQFSSADVSKTSAGSVKVILR